MRLSNLGLVSLVVASVAGCDVPTQPLVDLPEFRIVTLPTSRGSPVVVEVVNTTPYTVGFEALACNVRLQHLVADNWRPVEVEEGECHGLPLELAPGAGHSVSVETPTEFGGLFRAAAEGSSPEGPFEIRTPPFALE